VRGQVTT